MAGQDVNVKDIEAIMRYSGQLGEFQATVTALMCQLRQVAQQKLDSFREALQDVKEERRLLDAEIRNARDEFDNLRRNSRIVDYREISESKRRLEHLEGFIIHNVRHCVQDVYGCVWESQSKANWINDRSKSLETSLQKYAENGRLFLAKLIQYLEQYKETKRPEG